MLHQCRSFIIRWFTSPRRHWRLYRKYRTYTMIPEDIFLDNLRLAGQFCHVRGGAAECGTWRGGMIAALAEALGPERPYYLFDSFEGLPPVEAIDGPRAKRWQEDTGSPFYFDNCRADIRFAEEAMKLSGAPRCTIVKGWFQDTLPGFTCEEPLALLRLDSDWHASTTSVLEALYGQVVPGGLVIIDDYSTWDGCACAVHDFLSRHRLPDRIRQTPGGTTYIIKGS